MSMEKHTFLSMIFLCFHIANCQDFTNDHSTLAIVIDEDFLKLHENFEDSMRTFHEILADELRKVQTKINVKFYEKSTSFRKDVHGLISVASCENTWKLFDKASKENFPHLAISGSDCPRLPPEKAVHIPLIENGEEMPQILLDLRSTDILKWKNVILIQDESLDRDLISRVTSALTGELTKINVLPMAISLIKIEDSDPIQLQIEIYRKLSAISTKIVGNNFLIIVSRRKIDLIMEIANVLNLVNTETQFLYVISDTNGVRRKNFTRLESYLKLGDNVAFLYNRTEISTPDCIGGVFCHFRSLLRTFLRVFHETIKIEIETSSQVSGEEWEAMRPTRQERSSSMIAKIRIELRENGKCDNCTSWLFKSGDTWGNFGARKLLNVGRWSPIVGALMNDVLFLHISHGFREKTLKIATIHNPPWQIIKPSTLSNQSQSFSGLTFDILDELSRKLNFTYNVTVISSTEHSDGDGVSTNFIPSTLLEMLHDRTVMIGAFAATLSGKYAGIVNFTIPISTQTYTFLASRPKELSRALLFMAPFSGDTWLCLMVAILSVGPIFYVIHRSSPLQVGRNTCTIQSCIWYMYGALLQQGGMHLPRADSARILVGSWWLFVLVIATTYCGNLVAFLTFPEMDVSINTIDDLERFQHRITWSLNEGSYLEEELRNYNSRYKFLYTRRVRNATFSKFLPKIVKGEHVLIDWKINLLKLISERYNETGMCEFDLGVEEFVNEELGLILTKSNPFQLRFNREIYRLHQVGLIHKWLTNYLPSKEKCRKNGRMFQVNNHIVNMDDMQGSFFVLFLGILLAFCLIGGEKLWHLHIKNKMLRKNIQPFVK